LIVERITKMLLWSTRNEETERDVEMFHGYGKGVQELNLG